MKELCRHIEFLLCEHNSVALPGIGVFVTEDLQARYCEEERLYLPPVRSVSLDTSSTEDDGKLENCLIQLHHVTRNVAKKWISDYLDDIKPYEGFIQCNSPYIGGLLNNVYKRKIQLPNGHKLVRMHNGNMYTIVGGTLYKNGL